MDALKAAGRFRPALLPDGTQATDPQGKPQYILDARSGDFAAGNFYQLTGTARPGAPTFAAKIYWIPVTPMPGTTLTIAARSLDDPSRAALVVEQNRTSTSNAGLFFWPSATPLPAPGRWEVSASADGLSGCFDLTV